ncbi:MAG: DUF4054 domain-containing protein [Elusimicrobiota bacterium]|jgi:hypothetical protein|nr:DUF4054 domain-containing protein [Elusimicrobiota bacterium]
MVINITTTEFRQDFLEFSDITKYPESVVNNYIKEGYLYISNKNKGILNSDARKLCIELMIAHLLVLRDRFSGKNGDNSSNFVGGILSGESSSIDKISVSKSYSSGANSSNFQSWLSQTSYGQRLLVLLSTRTSIGIYKGGSMHRLLK